MTDAEFTRESPEAADRAAALFVDWLNELPEGSLKSHISRLSSCYREAGRDDLRLAVAWHANLSFCLFGAWRVDGRVELVGPYVHPSCRRQTVGAAALRDSFSLAWTEPDVFVHVPASYDWAPEILEKQGLERVAPILEDGVGDHFAFHSNMARKAATVLRNMHEPSGSGSWVVVLHNDDDTTFEFVTEIVMQTIDVNYAIASEYANLVHTTGSAAVRFCRTEWGAKRLVGRIERSARKMGFPLRVTYETR